MIQFDIVGNIHQKEIYMTNASENKARIHALQDKLANFEGSDDRFRDYKELLYQYWCLIEQEINSPEGERLFPHVEEEVREKAYASFQLLGQLWSEERNHNFGLIRNYFARINAGVHSNDDLMRFHTLQEEAQKVLSKEQWSELLEAIVPDKEAFTKTNSELTKSK